jgi:ESCRT-I complex subunit TSG101
MSFYGQQLNIVDGILYQVRCYRDPQRIRMEVADLLSKPQLASLTPQLRPFVRGAGLPQQLLCLQGTIPIYYNNVHYNIPMIIWIVDGYPFIPPVVYVAPTSDMIITPRHRHVDSAGMVYHLYLSSWNPGSSSLIGLVSTLSRVFSEEPPVRSQPQTPFVPTTQYQPPTTPQPRPLPSNPPPPYTTLSPSWLSQPQPAQHQPPPPSPQPPAYPPPPEYTPPKQTEDTAVVCRRNALASASDKMQQFLQQFYESTTKEIDKLMAESSNFNAVGTSLEQEKENILREIEQSEQELKHLGDKFDELNKWLVANDKPENLPDIDTISDPKDLLSKQLLYLVADDATIEDTLYYLDKALNTGRIGLDTYLKHVRLLCREQFLLRATIKKVHEAQRARAMVMVMGPS